MNGRDKKPTMPPGDLSGRSKHVKIIYECEVYLIVDLLVQGQFQDLYNVRDIHIAAGD